MNVELPNGTMLEGVPDGTSKDAIMQKAIQGGLATAEDFGIAPTVAPEPPQEDPSTLDNVGQWFKENIDVPAGIAGAMAAGSYAGRMGGPKAGVVGGIAGGALGTFGGSLASDALTKEDLDYVQATKDAGMSVGMDLAFLGTAKWAWPLIKSMRSNGKSVADAAEFFKGTAVGGEVGSLSSRKASQQILQEGGATLTPSQTGRARGYQIMGEQLARTGIFSQGAMKANAAKVNDIVSGALDDIVRGGNVAPGELGRDMYSVVEAGKHALQTQYSNSLDEVAKLLGNSTVSLKPLKATFAKMMRETSTGIPGEYKMDNRLFSFLQSKIGNLTEMPVDQMNAVQMIEYQKRMMKDLRNLATNENGVLNKQLDAEVTQVITTLDDAFQRMINKTKPAAAIEYAGARKAYSEGMGALLPKLNQSFIRSATNGDYTALGKMLTTSGSVDKVNAMMKSIDDAYSQVSRVRGPQRKAVVEGLQYSTAEEAKNAIRQSYIKELFPKMGNEFDIKDYANMATKFQSGDNYARLVAVMGKDQAKHVKQLMNVMKEASETPGSNIGELMLRAKEYGAIGALATGVATGQYGGLASGALAVLLAPTGMAKIATDPKRINKLLAYGQRKFKTREAAEMAFVNAFGDVLATSLIEQDDDEDVQ